MSKTKKKVKQFNITDKYMRLTDTYVLAKNMLSGCQKSCLPLFFSICDACLVKLEQFKSPSSASLQLPV